MATIDSLKWDTKSVISIGGGIISLCAVWYALTSDVTRVEDKVAVQDGRILKLETTIDTYDPKVVKLELDNIKEQLKDIADGNKEIQQLIKATRK